MDNRYEIKFTETSRHRFAKIPESIKPRIKKILDKLEQNPYAGDRLSPDLWECRAMRVFRIYYTIIENTKAIELLGYDAGFGLVIMLDYSDKDEQQHVINKLKIILQEKSHIHELLK